MAALLLTQDGPELNATEGDQICLIEGTDRCFEIRCLDGGKTRFSVGVKRASRKRPIKIAGFLVRGRVEPQPTISIRRGLQCISL